MKTRVRKFLSEEIKKYFLYFSEYLYINAYNKNFTKILQKVYKKFTKSLQKVYKKFTKFAMMTSAWRLVVFYYRSLNSLWRPITKKIEFCKCRKGADLWFWAPCNRTQNIYNKHTFQNFSKSLISQNFLKIVLKRSIWMFSKFFIRGGSQITFEVLGGWVVKNLEKLQTL